jgi:cytidylate kinase
VARTLARNWGFHYTATTNLRRIAEYAASHPAISKADKDAVAARVQKLMDAIDAEPKTLMWKLRAKLGTAIKWYNVVEEVQP